MVAAHNPITPPPQIRTLLIPSPPSCPSLADRRSGAGSSSSPAKRQRRPLKRARVTQDIGPCGEPEVQSSPLLCGLRPGVTGDVPLVGYGSSLCENALE